MSYHSELAIEAPATLTRDWTALTHRYARQYQISYYAAQGDIGIRRQANGDSEAYAWFNRVLAGERLAWNEKAA